MSIKLVGSWLPLQRPRDPAMSLINDSFAFCCFHPGSPSTPNCLLSSLLVCMQLPLPWIFKRSRIDLRSAFCCAIFSTVYMGHACSACHNNDSLWCQLRVCISFSASGDICLLFPPHSDVSLIDNASCFLPIPASL